MIILPNMFVAVIIRARQVENKSRKRGERRQSDIRFLDAIPAFGRQSRRAPADLDWAA
jgi:hypothetical protein